MARVTSRDLRFWFSSLIIVFVWYQKLLTVLSVLKFCCARLETFSMGLCDLCSFFIPYDRIIVRLNFSLILRVKQMSVFVISVESSLTQETRTAAWSFFFSFTGYFGLLFSLKKF